MSACLFGSLLDIPWLVSGVTTRRGRGTALAFLDGGARAIASARQVHGNRVVRVEGPPEIAADLPRDDHAHRTTVARWRFADADALMTRLPGVALAVSTADCVPVVLVDPEHRAVGVAHAGWRGLAAGVATELVHVMARDYGSRPAALRAALGPAVGPCCYSVGDEVLAAMRAGGRDAAFLAAGGRRHLDLWTTGERELLAAGVAPGAVESVRFCTACHPELFFSRRRDGGILGQMTAFAMMKEA